MTNTINRDEYLGSGFEYLLPDVPELGVRSTPSVNMENVADNCILTKTTLGNLPSMITWKDGK